VVSTVDAKNNWQRVFGPGWCFGARVGGSRVSWLIAGAFVLAGWLLTEQSGRGVAVNVTVDKQDPGAEGHSMVDGAYRGSRRPVEVTHADSGWRDGSAKAPG
jgi:hypothetical protein